MGLVHTPRLLGSIAKGSYKYWRYGPSTSGIGIGANPHIYTARTDLFDYDYQGHMNNAAYLSHAEYSRWQLSAETGIIQAGLKHNAGYVLSSTTVRYRREVKPLFRKFEVHSAFVALDDKFVYTKHDFRHSDPNDYKIRAQVIAKGAFIERRKVVNPKGFFLEKCGFDPELVETMVLKEGSLELEEIMALTAFEDSQRVTAAADDARIDSKK